MVLVALFIIVAWMILFYIDFDDRNGQGGGIVY